MRILALLVSASLALTVSAGSPRPSWQDRLESLGYLKGMSPTQQRRCRTEMRKAGTPWTTSCHRVIEADAEELAEGGFTDIFDHAAHLLAAAGAVSSVPRTESTTNGFLVYTDAGNPIDLYDRSIVKDQYDAWERASLFFQVLTNVRLRKAGSIERFYRVYFANDQVFVLLIPEMYQVVAASRLASKHKPEPLPGALR